MIFPKYRGDLLEARSSSSGCTRARSRRRRCRATRSTSSPSRSSRWPSWIRWTVDELAAIVRAGRAVRDADPRGARGRPRDARRRLSVRRVRRAEAAAHLGSGDRRIAGPARRPGRRDHVGRHDPRSRPVRRLHGRRGRARPAGGSASSTRRWSTRARAGEVITLGASSWRIEEIGHDRVTVRPAPGVPGQAAVLARRRGRPADRARAGARRVRPRGRGRPRAGREGSGRRRRPAPRARTTSTRLAAENLVAYLEEERETAGALPTDRRIVVERFRDELGDWRIVHPDARSAAGSTPRGRSPSRRASRERLGAEVRTIWSDDGIAIRLPEGELETDPAAVEALLFPEPGRGRGPRRRRRRRLGAVRVAVPRERRPGAAPAAPAARHPDAALAAAPAGGGPARRREPLRQLPDPRRDVPRVPVRRLRPARPARGPGRRGRAARSRSTASRRPARRRSRARSCSTTSPPTCTTATRRSPSGGPRR